MTFAVRVSMLAIGSLFAGVAAAQYVPPATVSQCRALDGFSTDPQGGAWLAAGSQTATTCSLATRTHPTARSRWSRPLAKGKPGVTYRPGRADGEGRMQHVQLPVVDRRRSSTRRRLDEAYATADCDADQGEQSVSRPASSTPQATTGCFPAVAERARVRHATWRTSSARQTSPGSSPEAVTPPLPFARAPRATGAPGSRLRRRAQFLRRGVGQRSRPRRAPGGRGCRGAPPRAARGRRRRASSFSRW